MAKTIQQNREEQKDEVAILLQENRIQQQDDEAEMIDELQADRGQL
jgi:hypothetical protein